MNRVVLINKTKNPSREELVTSERRMGELVFAPRLNDLNWAGYIIVEGQGRLAANWVIGDGKLAEFLDWVNDLDDQNIDENYEIAVFTNKTNSFGGQYEARVA